MPPAYKHQRQTGLALITALMLLAAASLLALAAAQAGWMAERGARHDQDGQIAWEAAEAALADAEHDIESPHLPGRTGLLRAGADSFAPDCGNSGDRRGLCRASAQGQPAWQRVDLARPASPAVDYGTFTGRAFDSGPGQRSARPPRYIIESVTDHGAQAAGPHASSRVYRITALGFGPRAQTQVALQTVYRARPIDTTDPSALDPGTDLPQGRLSWRHIPNYRQWHGALPDN